MSALHNASYHGNEDVVRRLIQEGATDLNARDPLNDTALHVAAHRDQLAIMKMLLDAGASINEHGAAGRMALHTAILHKRAAAGAWPSSGRVR